MTTSERRWSSPDWTCELDSSQDLTVCRYEKDGWCLAFLLELKTGVVYRKEKRSKLNLFSRTRPLAKEDAVPDFVRDLAEAVLKDFG